MTPYELIKKKRNGGTLEAAEIASFMRGYTLGEVPDYQMSALLMAIFFRGMTHAELAAWTESMLRSGEVLDLSDIPGIKVDKHSTGGVGDKVSLPLAPLAAACGVRVPMISGRGLGHTGGTLDKFESIPGYCAIPAPELFRTVVREVGVAIIGQTAQLAPADKRFYSIRDTTATVESIAMITGSILSKKLAAGLDALVMDVKVGSGAFMPSLGKSVELAESLVAVGNGAGTRTSAVLTGMNESLAPSAGNALEVRLAIDYLTGAARPARLHEVTLALCAEMLVLSGLCRQEQEACARLETALDSGQAAERFARMVAALGGPADLLERPDAHLERAPIVVPAPALEAGYASATDCRALGLAVVGLGGGRVRPQDPIDFAVGLTHLAELGERVEAGQPLALVHARTQAAAEQAVRQVQAAYTIGARRPAAQPMIYRTIRP